jgi:hypothetical protein
MINEQDDIPLVKHCKDGSNPEASSTTHAKTPEALNHSKKEHFSSFNTKKTPNSITFQNQINPNPACKCQPNSRREFLFTYLSAQS